MFECYRRLLRSEAGATVIEYGLIVALIALTLLSGLVKLGGSSGGLWAQILAKVSAAMSG